MEQITENVFAETKIRGCNPGYVITSDGVVIIDTPQLPTHAIRMEKECKAKGPIRYIINTEHHVDHIFGNYFFKSAEHILAHEETKKLFMVKYPELNPYEYAKEAMPTDDPEGISLFPDEETYFADPNSPDITIVSDATIIVGDHTFHLIHTPGHAPGQLAVYIPKERVAFVGDTIFNNCLTWLYASDLELWFKSLDRLLDLDVDVIIPGHGPICDKQKIYVQRAVLLEWISAVATAIAKGWSKEECIERISFLDRFSCDIGQEYMGPEVNKNNISALYDQLTVKMSVV